MSYNKIPKDWDEKKCSEAIHELIAEGSMLTSTGKYDKASQKFFMVAQILKSLPDLKNRLQRKQKVKDFLSKQKDELKKKEELKKIETDKIKNQPTVK